MKIFSSFFRWVFMKKKDINDSSDLYFYHTKRIVLVLILFLGISFLSALTFISLFQSGEMTISVPNVTGKTLVRAQLRLQRDDLHYKIKTKRFAGKPSGIVLAQEPVGGSTTKKQRAVLLFINTPSMSGTVPNLSGMSLPEAQLQLKQASTSNFKAVLFRRAYSFSETVPAGRIISQTPDWGVHHPSPVYVNLLISKGASSRKTILPRFTGQQVLQAMRWIAMNNATPKVVSVAGAARGTVASQEPAAGSALAPGQLVLLKTGSGTKYGAFNLTLPQELKLAQLNLKKTAPETSTNANLSDAERKRKDQEDERKRQQSLILKNAASYKVTVSVDEGGSSTTLVEGIKKPGDRIILTFPYTGQAVIRVKINDRLFFTRRYQ